MEGRVEGRDVGLVEGGWKAGVGIWLLDIGGARKYRDRLVNNFSLLKLYDYPAKSTPTNAAQRQRLFISKASDDLLICKQTCQENHEPFTNYTGTNQNIVTLLQWNVHLVVL